ncbi:hypothetical protein CH262_24345 [Rhodococcus sp. 05-2255-1e]|uniref:TetR/AcrR family transcriptional regulator n=1 Tax=Rhodococcus sp. 05-2255-1e TaxID=2022495 RepID=UPI000B9A459E|nr:TetR family transcriptional regulator C-terminal domain-containing protein [Rhodococcus sp. 05-2255-1e]OZE19473.1 hypothetical protein CH262_24345 [Rhodococcus sp. 05-2255-1e]
MTLSATSTHRRKDPQSRRRELAEVAGRLAMSEGLGQLTAKKVADEVKVYPGLVNHYFKTSDGLIAAGFAAAVEGRRSQRVGAAADSADALDRLRIFLDEATDPSHDEYALLWLDAWRESTRRPALQQEVVSQMEVDIDTLIKILESGCEQGRFAPLDCASTAMRILALIDGTFAQSAVRTALSETSAINYPIATDMVFRHTELELGLAPGTLVSS